MLSGTAQLCVYLKRKRKVRDGIQLRASLDIATCREVHKQLCTTKKIPGQTEKTPEINKCPQRQERQRPGGEKGARINAVSCCGRKVTASLQRKLFLQRERWYLAAQHTALHLWDSRESLQKISVRRGQVTCTNMKRKEKRSTENNICFLILHNKN